MTRKPRPAAPEEIEREDRSVPAEILERFRRDLDAIIQPQAQLGIAVSGGPDSLAVLVLAAAIRPGLISAATVDHRLRPESADEAKAVKQLCDAMGVPHTTLALNWDEKPETAIQERARALRYAALANWAAEQGIPAVATGHHLDDQAETLLMRLARGAGVRGLAGMRRVSRIANSDVLILRPLLGWHHSDLVDVCTAAGLKPADDPSNQDERFERVRIRKALAHAEGIEPAGLARSAAYLAEADAALQWAAADEWQRRVTASATDIVYQPGEAPREIRRRIVRRAVLALASEGADVEPRGRELDQLLAVLAAGGRATLRGVLCDGGTQWRFSRAPARKG